MSYRTLTTGPAGMLCGLVLTSCLLAQSPRVGARHERPGSPVDTSGEGPEQRSAARVGGPVLGYLVLDQSRLHPVYGVPGAAAAGLALMGVPELEAAAVSVERGYVLGAMAQGDGLALIRGLKDGPSVVELPGVADRVAVSPSGNSAVAYSSTGSEITVFRGLPEEPQVAWTSRLEAPLSALAVRDDGGAVLAAMGDSLIRLTGGSGFSYLAAVAGPVSVQFLAGGGDAVVADAGLNRVYRVREIEGGAEVLPLASESDGVSGPVAVAASADGARVFIANSDPAGVLSIGLDRREMAFTGCSCAPSRLARLSGNAVFQLTEASDGPVYVFDGDAAEPRIAFIPAPAGVRARRGGAR